MTKVIMGEMQKELKQNPQKLLPSVVTQLNRLDSFQKMQGNKIDNLQRTMDENDKKVDPNKFQKLLFDFSCMTSEVNLTKNMFNDNTYRIIEEIRRKIDDMYDQMTAVTIKADHMITIDTIEELQK